MNCAVVGETPTEDQDKKTFLFPVDDIRTIVPKDYFITTGEAIIKLDVLIGDLQETLKKAKSFKKKLIKTKGSSKWLETGWDGSGNLLVRKKEARPRSKNAKSKN